MNELILENAAIYVNAYRSTRHWRGDARDQDTLRRHVSERFGAVYAAILCP